MKGKKKTFFGGYDNERKIFWGEVELMSSGSRVFFLKWSPSPKANLTLFSKGIFPKKERDQLRDGDLVVVWEGKRKRMGRRVSIRRTIVLQGKKKTKE
ncbi:hypothetical protein HZB94_01650 [Candidatus Falkowbacteria bacterium]|nr:hypothetical protein [Candidatus Falkowbacteria bacterium]